MNRLILYLFILYMLPANSQELYFKPFPAFQSLPSFETYYSLQDSKGNIWVSSDAGVSLYDGNTVTHFTTKDGLSENVVFRIYEDKKGRIWFSTLTNLFFYYENNKFHAINANPLLKKYYTGTTPQSFFIGENDTLYFCPLDFKYNAIIKIPPQNNYEKVIRYTTDNIQKNGTIYISNPQKPTEGISGNGGNRSTLDGHRIYWDDKIYHIPPNVDCFKFGNLWKFAINYKADILYIARGLKLLSVNKKDTLAQQYPFKEEIIYIYYDKDGDLWVLCKRGGGYFYKNADLTKRPIHFLKDLSVSAVMEDREGSIWATTLEKGVFICKSKELISIPHENNDKICSIQVDTNRLWVSYFSKKLFSFFKNDRLLKDTAKCVYPPENYLEFFYQGRGYNFFDKHIGTYYVQENNNKASQPIQIGKGATKGFLKLNGDTVLIASHVRLYKFVREKKTMDLRTPFVISCLTKLHDGTVLIGSRDNKGIFELKNNTFVPYHSVLTKLMLRINGMVEDKQNRLWIASENGLMCLDEKKTLHNYNNQQGPLSLKMIAVAIDKKNNVWCSNGNALICLKASNDLTNLSMTIFNTSHGLPDTRIEKLVVFNDSIWCATKDYLFYFKNGSLKKNPHAPITNIKSIFINNVNFPRSDNITVSHNQNNITIETTSSSYKSTEHKSFYYKLEGYDKDWQSLNKGNIQYTNLDHGIYKLFVYSVNNDGIEGSPASFTLVIKSPFWFTWWFITLEILAALLLIYAFFVYWKNKIEKREQEKTLINQKIAEFKMTALRSQMNPHFIFNAIGSIQHFILQNEAKQSYNYLAKFSMLIRNILNNSRDEYISLSQEINTLQLYIELEQIRFTKPFKFIIDIDENIDMESYIPTMLIQPYIENSIWHGLTPKPTEGLLELIFNKVGNLIHVIIRDNGVGRKVKPSAQKHVSKGMSITEQRIKTLETTTTIKFKTNTIDLKDEFGSPIGTEVHLVIPYTE